MGRFDAIGMFWKDKGKRATKKHEGPMPSIPQTGWRAPRFFPNLSGAAALAVDVETYDPELRERGPGWARGVGHIVGVSIGATDRQGNIGKWYFPMRHETCLEENLNPEQVLAWLRDVLSDPLQPKIGANLSYDVGWLRQEGVFVKGKLIDVQFAEALLDEAAPVALEVLGQKYLNEGKQSEFMYEWLSEWFGGKPNGDQRKHIYRAPPSLVGPYAESDVDLPLRLINIMYPLMHKQGLIDLFNMENALIPLMNDMRFAGVTVNVVKAEELQQKLILRSEDFTKQLAHVVGSTININSGPELAWAFDKMGLKYGTTDKGAPSFTKQFLQSIDHPVAKLICEIRKVDKLRGTFIESYILDSHINGMIYGSFHQLRGDDGGTRSGRFSSSGPNLQNIPSNDKELAPLIRGLFIPDVGHVAWRKYDYSQVEYRMLINYAVGPAGEDIRAFFNKNPNTDYHVYAQQVIKEKTGIFIERKPIKSINFGLIYGMGVTTLAAALNMTVKKAKELMRAYFEGVPFAKPTMDATIEEALSTGVITTVMGRRSRFDMWEPREWAKKKKDFVPLPYDQAVRKFGGDIQRAFSHKALNRRLQGSSADLMKKAMQICYEDGIFDETGVPRLTVHDELDFSDPGSKDKAFKEMQRVMETAISLNVPFKADGEIGPDWGHVKDIT